MVLLKPNQTLREKYSMAVQNKFEALKEADEVTKKCADFKAAIIEATEEQLPRAEKKTKQRWMTEDILDLMVIKEASKKIIKKNMKHCILRKSEKKCDEAKEKWINNKRRKIELYRRTTKQTMYKNIKETSGKKTRSFTGCLKLKYGNIILEKEKNSLTDGHST